MIHNLKPYPAYKDSGVPWLGEVPEHWEVRRVKQLCRFIYGDSLPTEARQHGDIAVFGSNGRVGSHIISNTHSPCIVIGRKGSFGKVNFSADRIFAIDTTFYIDDRFTNANLRWLYYLLGCLRLDEVSNDSAVPGLHREEVYQKIVAYPADNDEQFAIAQYLDHINRLISRYIRAKKKLIKLLEEQKQAIIHQAVTRGLDPNVKLKPSGVEWLGDVPEHWEIISLGAASELIQTGPFGSQLHSHEYIEGGVPVINPSHMQSGCIVPDMSISISQSKADSLQRHKLQLGDIIAARRGELGRCALVTVIEEDWICGTGSLQIRCKKSIFDPEYLLQLFSSQGIRDSLSISSIGATMDNLNSGMVSRLRLPLPFLDEQRRIIELINVENKKSSLAVSAIKREISLLREYRTRLISDVVTGKLDVREAAASLPEETNETEALDEELTDEEDTAEEEFDREPEEE